MTATEAAAELGISRPRVHQLARSHQLEAGHLAGRLLIRRSSLTDLRRRRQEIGHHKAFPAVSMKRLRQQRDRIVALAASRGAYDVRVFGSVARGEARPGSDVDFLVAMEPGRTVLDLAELIVDLEELLGQPVDVIEIRRRSRATAQIQAEAVPL